MLRGIVVLAAGLAAWAVTTAIASRGADAVTVPLPKGASIAVPNLRVRIAPLVRPTPQAVASGAGTDNALASGDGNAASSGSPAPTRSGSGDLAFGGLD